MATGTVTRFNATRGDGFIQPDRSGSDIVLHVSAIERGARANPPCMGGRWRTRQESVATTAPRPHTGRRPR